MKSMNKAKNKPGILLTLSVVGAIATTSSFSVAAQAKDGVVPLSVESGKQVHSQYAASLTEANEILSFNVIKTPYPTELTKAVSSVKLGGFTTVQGANATYVVIGAGAQPTSGYSVVVSKVEKIGDQIVVYASVKKPERGSFNLQVITYPVAVIALSPTNDPITVQFN